MKKFKTIDIYNSCSGKKGSSCDSIDYMLPEGVKTDDVIVGKCGSKGCKIFSITLPNGKARTFKS